MDYIALKNEVDNNPKSIPDLSWDQTDEWIRDTLNTPGISNETTTRESVTTADIITALYSDVDGFKDINQLEATKLNWLSPVGSINPSDLQAVFLDMFPTGGVREPIKEALVALATRPASRAEKIPDVEQNLSTQDVHLARRL